MKRLAPLALLLCAAGALSSQPQQQLEELAARSMDEGEQYFRFEQEKRIDGLPRPLVSRGYLKIGEQALRWVTESPVASEMLIDEEGIVEISGDGERAIEGSELVARLMIAVLNQDHAYLDNYFSLEEHSSGCLELLPERSALREQYQRIELCGEAVIETVTLHESNGGYTTIRLSEMDEDE